MRYPYSQIFFYIGIVSIACLALLIQTGSLGYEIHNGRTIGKATGAGFAIFIPALIVGLISYWIGSRSAPTARLIYAIVWGAIIAVGLTGTAMIGSSY